MPQQNLVPPSVMQAVRDELNDVPLTVHQGTLPEGLSGHLFIMGPVGNVDEARFGTERPTLLNGDGMVYRIDLDGGAPRVTSRLIKPGCYWADQASAHKPEWERFRFGNLGIARGSLLVGFRNFGNTALVPLGPREGQAASEARLLVTYDAGRPLEIDPVSLETLTPVGATREWKSELLSRRHPFPLILSSAHPVWDSNTGHLFTVNYGRSVANLLGGALVSPPPGRVQGDGHKEGWLRSLAHRALERIEKSKAVLQGMHVATRVANRVVSPLLEKLNLLPSNFVRLVRWDGEGELETWNVLCDGKPIRIQDSMHQLAVTEDYIILADTNFKVGMNQWFYNPKPHDPALARLFRLLNAHQQLPETLLYIIPRAALENAPRGEDGERVVHAVKSVLQFGAVHFLANYKNPGGKLTLHMAHGVALDIAEWVRTYDVSPLSGEAPPDWLSGMITGAVDQGRLGRYVIDASTGVVTQSQVLSDQDALWSLALYTANGVPAWNKLPDTIDQLYWFSNGYWPQLLTQFVTNLYASNPSRLSTMEQLLELGRQGGTPPCLFRLDTKTMTIADRVEVQGELMSSPQFVPAPPGGAPGAGWIIATVVNNERSDLCIFDALDLSKEPVRLGSPQFNFGFTLHTAWLPEIAPSTSRYYVDPREDFGPGLTTKKMHEFFEQEVYPHVAPRRTGQPPRVMPRKKSA